MPIRKTARRLNWAELVKKADPKPRRFERVYDFKRPKYERVLKPGQPYPNPAADPDV